MNAHIILDPFRAQTNETLEKELETQGINGRIWPAIHDSNSVVKSINLSHKMIVAFAKAQNFPEICILEEDVMFIAPDGWQYFLANKPEKFHLYLGGCYGLNDEAYKRIANTPGSTQINNFAGLHCYVIHESYYDKFLSMPDDIHIDNQPGMGVFYVCSPMAALQHPGWSSNHKVKVDYNTSIPKECIYYGKG